MKHPRREFLRTSALGLGGGLVGASRLPASAAKRPGDPFATIPLGRSSLKTSRFCLGTGMEGGERESNHTRMGRERFGALIHAAGKGVVGMKIVGESRLRDQPDQRSESVRFSLGLGCVDVFNVGCESTAEIDDLTSRMREVRLPA